MEGGAVRIFIIKIIVFCDSIKNNLNGRVKKRLSARFMTL
jgi:hypothetical protein